VIEVGVSPARMPAGEAADLEVRLTNTGRGGCMSIIFTIRLPAGITRLRGRERIEVGRLDPGQSVTSHLRVQAEGAGHYQLTSANFSYRDHRGQPHRETGFSAELVAGPKLDPLPEPRVTVELPTTELPCNEWTSLRGRIVNCGMVGVSNLEITVSGQVIADQRGARIRLEELPAGQSADVSFFVRARETGPHVPVHLDITYSVGYRRYSSVTTHSINVLQSDVLPPVVSDRRQPTVQGTCKVDDRLSV